MDRIGRAVGDWCYEHIFATTMLTLAATGLVIGVSGVVLADTECAEQFVVPAAKSMQGCDDVFGHGISYGPREARRSIVVWDCPDGLVVELTEYGEPRTDLDMHGEVIGQAVLPPGVLAWLQGEACPQ